jgi:Na+/H+ antiporter NhaD/arsenite permease-like protein
MSLCSKYIPIILVLLFPSLAAAEAGSIVGGSMLAVSSAAGVGLMGQAKGIYTFTSHLKWTPVIALGYFGSIAAHFLINGRYF